LISSIQLSCNSPPLSICSFEISDISVPIENSSLSSFQFFNYENTNANIGYEDNNIRFNEFSSTLSENNSSSLSFSQYPQLPNSSFTPFIPSSLKSSTNQTLSFPQRSLPPIISTTSSSFSPTSSSSSFSPTTSSSSSSTFSDNNNNNNNNSFFSNPIFSSYLPSEFEDYFEPPSLPLCSDLDLDYINNPLIPPPLPLSITTSSTSTSTSSLQPSSLSSSLSSSSLSSSSSSNTGIDSLLEQFKNNERCYKCGECGFASVDFVMIYILGIYIQNVLIK
jgi:hypothetical protein